LRADKRLAKGLRVLHLVDQYSGLDKALNALSKSRKKLQIKLGDTDKWGDGEISKYLGGKADFDFGHQSGYGFTGFGLGGGFGRW
jgi:hypothetical protein